MISKLQLGDDEMSTETYIQMKGEEITELELNTDKLVGVALGTNFAPRGGHYIVKLRTTCEQKKTIFSKLHHQNGSKLYQIFFHE
jgi:hypothetical protein